MAAEDMLLDSPQADGGFDTGDSVAVGAARPDSSPPPGFWRTPGYETAFIAEAEGAAESMAMAALADAAVRRRWPLHDDAGKAPCATLGGSDSDTLARLAWARGHAPAALDSALAAADAACGATAPHHADSHASRDAASFAAELESLRARRSSLQSQLAALAGSLAAAEGAQRATLAAAVDARARLAASRDAESSRDDDPSRDEPSRDVSRDGWRARRVVLPGGVEGSDLSDLVAHLSADLAAVGLACGRLREPAASLAHSPPESLPASLSESFPESLSESRESSLGGDLGALRRRLAGLESMQGRLGAAVGDVRAILAAMERGFSGGGGI